MRNGHIAHNLQILAPSTLLQCLILIVSDTIYLSMVLITENAISQNSKSAKKTNSALSQRLPLLCNSTILPIGTESFIFPRKEKYCLTPSTHLSHRTFKVQPLSRRGVKAINCHDGPC